MRQKALFFLVALMFLAASAVYLTPVGCGLVSGKWGSSEGLSGLCTTQLCYRFGNCGHWANPHDRCAALKEGDSVSKVVFELGQPDTETAERLSWNAGKGGTETIKALISDARLTRIECDKKG
jgi:hypothetical protein